MESVHSTPVTRGKRHSKLSAAAVGLTLLGLTIATAGALRNNPAAALASCLAHTNTSEELTFLGGLQAWRDQNIPGSFPLTRSAPLNAAAAGYAKYLIDHPGSGGHYADGGAIGRAWADRAIQCGYPANAAAGGEGLAVDQRSGAVSVSPTQALSIMTAERGGGVWVPSNVGPDVRCVGVAKLSAANGQEDAWVTLLFGTWDGTCPQAVTGAGASPTPTTPATGTPTATATATPTRTPTPTATPTPNANYNQSVAIYSGWNLVTLPLGPLGDILDTVRQCFSAVYQPEGDHWLRYVPGVPGYATNMAVSNGGAFWILGTDANCGRVPI